MNGKINSDRTVLYRFRCDLNPPAERYLTPCINLEMVYHYIRISMAQTFRTMQVNYLNNSFICTQMAIFA